MSSDRRPRLDAVIRAIKDGKYDDELVDISRAVNERFDERKRAVIELVKATFGENATVNDVAGIQKAVAKTKTENSSLNVTKHGTEFESDNVLVDPDPGEIISAEKPPQEGLTGEWESRSPQFGSIEGKEN